MRIIVVILIFWLTACGSKDETKKPVKEKDDTTMQVTDTTDKRDSVIFIEQKISLDDIPKTRDVRERLIYFKEKYLVNYSEINPEELKVDVLDRFTADKKYKFHLQKKSSVKYGKVGNIFPVMNIRAYTYADSAQCANAMNNWYNCFGNDCSTIKVGEDATIKTTPGYYIINPTYVICLDYLVEYAENNWSEVTAHLKKLFATKGSIIINIKPQGKLKWELL